MRKSLTVIKKQAIYFVFLLFLLLSVDVAWSQNPFFRNLKLPDEMQQTTITCLYQDLNNFMWVGTSKGLYQFNGTDFTYYEARDQKSQMQISAIYMTPDHTLWVGTRKGEIYNLHGDSLQSFNPEEGNPKVAVTGFAVDKSRNLWFSTYGEGLYVYDGTHIYNFNTDDGLTDDYCYAVKPDDQSRIWVATDGGISICSFNNNKKLVQKITSSQGLPDNIVTNLTPSGTYMWVGMHDEGICKIDTRTLKITVPKISDAWQYGAVKDIVSGKNWIWVATEQNGILSINPLTGESIGNYTSADNINFSRINQLISDRQGNYWIASGNQLLLSLGNELLNFTQTENVADKNIHSVFADSKGQIWYSSDGRLFNLNKLNGKTSEIKLPLKTHTHIISLFEDSQGYIWAGTFGSGLLCIDPTAKRVKLFGELDGLSNGNILSITGKGSELWLATLGGAYKCEIPGDPFTFGSHISFFNYGDQHFPGNNYIYSVLVDSKDRVWFATDGKGISMLDKGRFINFDKPQGLKSNVIYSIAEDSDGDIWFSTSNAGVYRYNGKSLSNYSVNNGLSDLHITGLLADKNHHLVIVHTNGVDIIDTRTNIFTYYGSGIGLSEINPDLNVCALEGEDMAWIGTQNGLVRLQIPQDISKRQPSLQLDMISVFLGNENFLGEHVFTHNQNYLSFHFNSLWYIAPALVKYQIRLKGYDLDWIDTRNNLVTYPNLPSGKYTFEVRSSIRGNFNQSEIISYAFRVQKPFWKTNWFILLSVLLLGLLVYFIVHLREKTLTRRDASEREKIMFQFQTLRSQVNPHFLFNSFSTLISIIDEDKDIAIQYVEKLSQFFRDILDYRDVNLIPLSEELDLIETYYYLQKKRYCENLRLEISIDEKELNSLIPPMVLQMLVENAIKHNIVSAEKPLTVTIRTNESNLVVTNNFQPKKVGIPSTGIGLTNIRNRYRLLGFGEVIIDTSNLEFKVILPIIYSGK